MYKTKKRFNKNGYIVIENPKHPNAFDTTGDKRKEKYCVYEHTLVAEELLDRPLKPGEVVHHLDNNRSNNSPENLLVLSGPMHGKLHSWINKNLITPKLEYQERIDKGCIRCKICEKPINYGQIYCSHVCSSLDTHRYIHPTKEELQKLVWEKPVTQLAEELSISSTSIKKLCEKLGIEKPARGYWSKQKAL